MQYRILSRALLVMVLMRSGLSFGAVKDSLYTTSINEESTHSTLNVPEGFGKTHFIAGFPHETATHKTSKNKRGQSTSPAEKTVLFSPDDNLQQALIDLIGKECASIKVAIYTFTDKDIAQALIDAHKRGVEVQIVTDPCQLKDRYSKCLALKEKGIKVFEYDPTYIKDMRSNLMHHKFAIFGCDKQKDCCVWTGSFNFTQAACKRNQENALIVKDAYAVKRFSDQFELLKQRCRKK